MTPGPQCAKVYGTVELLSYTLQVRRMRTNYKYAGVLKKQLANFFLNMQSRSREATVTQRRCRIAASNKLIAWHFVCLFYYYYFFFIVILLCKTLLMCIYFIIKLSKLVLWYCNVLLTTLYFELAFGLQIYFYSILSTFL